MAILKESWQLLSTPASITVKNSFNHTATIVIEPLERGFGNTIGNSLRRILLSSIAGFAPTSVKIDNVLHEYGFIEGVKEDVANIIMNIKSLAIDKPDSSPAVLKLSSSKPGEVFASSIETNNGVEIINKDLLICTLSKEASIDMQINVGCGRGYVPAFNNKTDDLGIGYIAIDCLFSPIKRVSYKVENARVGQITDYDRLIIEIDTNGTITPQDALGVAAKIMQEQLEVFINFDASKIVDNQKESIGEPEFNKNLLKTIDELELSVRSYNCLKNENIMYVGDLVIKTEGEMLKTSNFGRKSLNELKENLKSMGLVFGAKISNWPPKNLEELSKTKSKNF